jgi:hypothetical protein
MSRSSERGRTGGGAGGEELPRARKRRLPTYRTEEEARAFREGGLRREDAERELREGPAAGTGSAGGGHIGPPDVELGGDPRIGQHEAHAPEERDPLIELYDVAPEAMPPSPAGGGAETGGEAAASRRLAGLPPELAAKPDHRAGVAADAEPFLGYDGLDTAMVLDWIRDADPDAGQLRRIAEYEAAHRHRESILRECEDRIRRLEE